MSTRDVGDSDRTIDSAEEYADDIISYIVAKDKGWEHPLLCPSYLRWRKFLVQAMFNVPFSFSLDTCVLAINVMDKFVSRKGNSTLTIATHLLSVIATNEDEYMSGIAKWRIGMVVDDATQWRSFLLLAGIALTVASKYEENQSHQVGMTAVVHLLGIRNMTRTIKSQLAKAEKVFLQAIEWDLSDPGPLPFLRHSIYRRRRPYLDTSEERISDKAKLEQAAASCIRLAMTHNDFIWYRPSAVASICHELASCVVQSSTSYDFTRLIADHHTRMGHLAIESPWSAWEIRRGMRMLLLLIMNGPFIDQHFCWWDKLRQVKCLIYWLWSEECLHRQCPSRGLGYDT